MPSNCVVFAIRLWWRRRRKDPGCYVGWRVSWHGPWPHCGFVSHDRRHYVAYVPIRPLNLSHLTGWRAPLRVLPVHLLLFRGRVKWGDPSPRQYPMGSIFNTPR